MHQKSDRVHESGHAGRTIGLSLMQQAKTQIETDLRIGTELFVRLGVVGLGLCAPNQTTFGHDAHPDPGLHSQIFDRQEALIGLDIAPATGAISARPTRESTQWLPK
jgi:hypothetical protein